MSLAELADCVSLDKISRSPSSMSSKGSPDKALASILPLISSGQAYEAHQKARTFASRYVKAGAFDSAVQVLFQSAKELLKAGHAGSGSDLGVYMIDVYYDMEQELNDASRGIIPSISKHLDLLRGQKIY